MGEELETQGEPAFDMVAAQLRADSSDVDTFFRVLVVKLSEALGDRARLERQGGLLKRDKPVMGIELDLTSEGSGVVLSARRDRTGVSCSVLKKVRGIALSTKQVPMSEWVEQLVSAIKEEADRSGKTWQTLHGLLS